MTSDRYGLMPLAALLAALLVIRLAALWFNQTNLFFDEAQYWAWSRDLDFGYYSKPPVIAWTIRLFGEACGDSEFCVRLASPLLYTVAGLFVYLTARRLYDEKIAFWAGITFVTLPGVAFSSGIISTDVPLLAFWSIALYAFTRLTERADWWSAILLGAALGVGLLAKYAMAYFLGCAGLYIALTPACRRLLKTPHIYIALLIAAIIVAPNIAWNLENGMATFSHTADNAKWGGKLFHFNKALEFLAAQFGVFGPILFAALIVAAHRWLRGKLQHADRLCLAFCLPIIAIVTVQAFLSRAHANWAATAYVAATILVVAVIIGDGRKYLLKLSLALHLAIVALLAVANAYAGSIALPSGIDPYARVLGWRGVGEVVAKEVARAREAGRPYGAIVTVDRAVVSELLYYARRVRVPITSWRGGPVPRDHFQLVRPFKPGTSEPVLLVTLKPRRAAGLLKKFGKIQERPVQKVPGGKNGSRSVHMYALAKYQRD